MPKDYRGSLRGRLVGISDRALDQHVGLYERYCAELEQIAATYPRVTWIAPPGAATVTTGAVSTILRTPIGQLPLSLDTGRLGDVLARLRAELQTKALDFWPSFYLGGDDFWTTDRATSINIPWFLGSTEVWDLVCAREMAYTEEDVLRVLRHEYAHALLYAYEGWKRPLWRAQFGDFEQPYRDAYDADPALALNFVNHLGRPGPAQLLHYAQKHPDEDWAETFATWLGMDWDSMGYIDGALAKLRAVDALVREGAFYGEPVVIAFGRPEPYTLLTETVGDYLGAGHQAFSMHTALLQREPEIYAAVALHELYFDGLSGEILSLGPMPSFATAAIAAFGSFESWLLDMRAIAGSTNGWGVTAWDPRAGLIRNFLVRGHSDGLPPDAKILVAMDTFEHVYALDYGAGGKHLGIAAFFRNLSWSVVEARLRAAQLPGLLGPDHQFGMVVPQGGSSCARCLWLGPDGSSCANPSFQQWAGGSLLPAPADEYCCDVYAIRPVPTVEPLPVVMAGPAVTTL